MCMCNEMTNGELSNLIKTLEKEEVCFARMGMMGVVDNRLIDTVSTLQKARTELARRINEYDNRIK